VRKQIGICALLVAAAVPVAHGQGQRDAVHDANISLQMMSLLMATLRAVRDVREVCVMRYPSDAETIRAAYEASSVPAYFDMLGVDDSVPTVGRPNERPDFEDLDRQACVKGFEEVLDDFDARFADRIEAMKIVRDEVANMPPSLPFSRDAPSHAEPSAAILELARRGSTDDTLSPEGSKVQVLQGDASPPQADSSCVLLSEASQARATLERATTALRNQAARQGGDTVFVRDISTTGSTTTVAGTIFRCN
jgi:hypothetical protein